MQSQQKLLNVLKTISNSINENHTELIMSEAMEIPNIETTYYHGEIDDLTEEPLDFINLNLIKSITSHLLSNYDNTITKPIQKPFQRKQSYLS